MQKIKSYFQSYNGQVLQRLIAAILLGYIFANTLAIATVEVLVQLLSVNRLDATVTGSLLSFVYYTAIILWVFSVKHLAQVWRQQLIATAISLIIILALKGLAQLS